METLLILIIILGLIFDFTNGFHDTSSVVSTIIATKVLHPISAIVLASVLNFIGATQISGVAQTISTGIVETQNTEQIVVLSALLAAIGWNIFTWYLKMPSSSSYALIGGLIGASYINAGLNSILWKNIIIKIILPMIYFPIIAFSFAYIFMRGILFFLHQKHYENKLFNHLQLGSSCFVALSHGLNDAQKSMGIITLGLFAAKVIPTTEIPFWVILSCALFMGLGTGFGGYRITKTLAYSITKIEPIQGFAAETCSSSMILTASFLGMPVSSTQLITGSITGVGTAKSIKSVYWNTLKKITLTWIWTLPGAFFLGAICCLINKWIDTSY